MSLNSKSSADNEFEDQDGVRGGKEKFKPARRHTYSRASNRPSVHNGIHRRRNKRVSW
jgi:hypothetical protein